MPFDPTKPYETVAPPFDPSKPFEVAPRFDPSKAFEPVKGAGRDTSRDSYEAQLADLGLTEADAAEATRQSDKQADLLAAQRQAARQGEYQQGVINRIDALTGNVVEPLSRPLSGVAGRAADVLNNAALPENLRGPLIEQALQRPVIDLPRAGEAETTGGKVVAGTYNAAADLLASLSSPDVLAMLPAAANKAVLTAWIAQMAGHAPERVLKATQLFKEGKTQQAVQEVAAGVGELGLAELGRRQVMPGERLTMADMEGQPRLRINERGEAVDLPNPDTVARNLAAPGTLRPQEQRAWAPPTLDAPADMVNFERVPIFNQKGEVTDVQVRPRIREIVIEEPHPRAERATELQREEPQLETESLTSPLPPRTSEPRPEAPTISEPPPPEVRPNAPTPAAETPGLISGTALDKWANDVLRGGATHAGPDVIAAYVVHGAALMERGVRKFAEWSAKMIAEHGDAIRPHLRAVFEESQRGLARVGEAIGESKTRMRKLSVRAGDSRMVPGELKPQLKADPISYYQQQNVRRGVDAVAHMTNAELESVPETSKVSTENIKTLARFEQMKRLWAQADELQSRGDATGAAAKRQAGYNVLTDLSQTLTSFGQLINQAKQMVGASPDMIVRMVNRKLQEAKLPVLRPAEEMVIRRLSEESIGANVRHRAAEDAWFETPTDANAEAVARAKDLANAADAHLRERLHRLQPRTFADTLVTLEQGSVQAPISLAANVSGNLGFLPMDPAARAVATGLDMVHALFRKGGREIAAAPWSASVAGARSLGRGAQAAGRILARGASESDLAADMAHQPLRPLIAWRDLIAGVAAKMTGREQPPFARQRGILALEAMPQSMMASAVLRINAATDVMFREPIRARLITEAMKLRELKGRQRIRELEQNRNRTLAETQELLWLRDQTPATSTRIGQALKTPELFLDEATRSRIDNEARHAVFQGNNFLSSWVNWGLNQASPWGRFGLRQLALFVNTPTNFLGKMFSYMPVTGAVNTLRHALAGDSRAAKLAAGRMVVGTIYSAMALYLYKQGLISPSLNSPTDQQKERLMGQDFFPPGTLNVSGLARVKSGRSGAWRPGDRVVELNRLGGPGFLMLSMADIERAKEMRPPEEASGLEDAGQAVLAQLTQPGNYAVNQSFLKGTATGLNALLTGDFDKWAQSVEEGLVSIGLPNTLTAITRATRDAKIEVRGDSQLATLQNILKNRVAGVERLVGKPGSDVGLPVRRGLFGEPLPETPEGANPLVYQFFDITKGRTIPNDPVLAHVYGLYRKTGDSTVLPAPPDAHFGMFKQNFELTRQQVSDLQEQVGKARYTLARAIVDNPKFLDAPVDAQRAILKQAWEAGNLFGKMRFAATHPGELKEKGKPVGFEPAP